MPTRRRACAALTAAAVMSAFPAASLAGSDLAIRHVPVACLIADAHPRIDACFLPRGELARARVRFRAEDGASWYFVDMSAEGDCFAAVLPRPLRGTRRVHYLVEAASRSSGESRTDEFAPRVERDMEACGGSAAPTVSRASIVIGREAPEAAAVPPGFSAAGLASTARARPGGGGLSKALLIGGAVAAGGAAVALLAGGKEIDPSDVDDDGDGVSEAQGDCNDADTAVRPGGDLQFTVDFAFSGTTACATRNPQQQVYRVTNRSCDTVALQTLQVALTLGGTCTGGENYSVPLETAQIAPGATAVVRRGAPAGTVAPLCCQSYPCPPGTCTISLQYALGSSAGTRTVTQTYGIADVSGRDCPLCGSIGTDETLRPEGGAGGEREGLACSLAPY